MIRGSVSVVLPTFNRAHLLARALRSVLAQTRPAEEILVVDDGSRDGTAELVRSAFPAVRYLSQQHRGVSAARNRGIGAATGEWIAFLDSDDEWRPRKLELQLAALERQPRFRVCHSEETWIRRGRRVNPRRRHAKRGGRIFRQCLELCAISPSAALIHRTLFDEVGLFDPELPACEDYDLWLRICAREQVLLVAEPLTVKHGGHSDQLSERTPALDRYRIRALEKLLRSGAVEGEDRRAALGTLAARIGIYAAGARKRGRAEEADAYLMRRRAWLTGAHGEAIG